MTKIVSVSNAVATHMPGLRTWRALPQMRMDEVDPYLFLNHHGPDFFPENNQGLPFGPHPHRGFETLTFIVDGELVHKDSEGFSSRILKGGVQWMTAGAGIIHSETSSDEFLQKGGNLEILQLWINLPAAKKNIPAHYQGFDFDQIPHLHLAPGILLDLICGEWNGETGPVTSPYDQFMATLRIQKDCEYELEVPAGQKLFYLVSGDLDLEGTTLQRRQLAKMDSGSFRIKIKALSEAYIIFGAAPPIQEPIAAQGPFVMNTKQELLEAFLDYEQGKMGTWKE